VPASSPAGRRRRVPRISDEEYVVVLLDLETTGLTPKLAGVLQIAAKVLGSDHEDDAFAAFVAPWSGRVPNDISKLTGIDDAMLAAAGAQPFHKTFPRFLSWLDGVASRPASAHAASSSSEQRDMQQEEHLLADAISPMPRLRQPLMPL
ncbi:unnamed protein product, partial [Phaeothamnion confervicola]